MTKERKEKKPADEAKPGPTGPSAPAPAPASGDGKTVGRPSVPDSGIARQLKPGEATKTTFQVTRSVEDPETRQKIMAAVEEETPRPSVVRPPGVEPVPSSTVPGAPRAAPPTTVWKPITQPTSVVRPTPGPKPSPQPKALGAKEVVKPPPETRPVQGLPSWYRPDPSEPFPLTADDVQVDLYPILEPYAYVLITFHNKDKEMTYRVIEPQLTADEQKILKFIEHTMVDLLDVDPTELEKQKPQEFLAEKFDEILYDYAVVLADDEIQEQETKKKLLYYVYRDFIGESRVDVMTRDDQIEDISCDGAHQPIFLYHRKYESVKSNVKFANDTELDSFVIRLAQRAGKHISIADPILDATMRDGSRIQATLSREVSAHGSTFTIRKFRSEPFTPPDLVKFGTMSAEILAYWWIAIQHAASAIYAGGTASGKTTSLNAILLFIPPQMKIVSIEDTRELSLPHPNWIPGVTRSGFGAADKDGRRAGEIDMFQLLKNALRQRPEYIIVGEVRGKEAYNLFQAMATGHAAYGTMHADSVDAVIHRLESDPINIPRNLLEALDVISIQIQTRVGGKRVRRTKQLAEIVGIDPHTREILTNEVFRWQPKDDSFRFSGVSYVLERIQVEKGMTPQQMKQEMENRVEIIKYMIRHSVRNYRDVARIVSSYYKDPASVMERVQNDAPWS